MDLLNRCKNLHTLPLVNIHGVGQLGATTYAPRELSSPAWFWSNIHDYWTWPPSWISLPELPGALAVQSFKSVVEEEEEVVSEPAEDYGSVNLQLLFPQSPNHQLFDFSPNSEIPVFVTAESDEHFEVHLFYIHESDVNESYLAPMVEYGGEGNASYRTGRYEYFIHQNGAQITPGFDRSGTYEITARAYPLGQFSEADALFLINTPADILNDPLAFDENNTLPVNKLMGSASSSFEINPFTGSLPPEVTLEEFKYISATSTSVIPLAASGIDPDGSFKGVILCEWGGLWRPHSSPIRISSKPCHLFTSVQCGGSIFWSWSCHNICDWMGQ